MRTDLKEEGELITINYWKDVKKDIDNLLFSRWNTMLLIHNSSQFSDLLDFFNKLPFTRKILYISMSRTFDSIKSYLKPPNFKRLTKVYVVDCVSSLLFKEKKDKGCFYEEPPSNFKELAKLIDRYILKLNPELVVLDSLKQFVDFSVEFSSSNSKIWYAFLNYLRNRSESSRKFILLYDGNPPKIIPRTNIDLILKLEVVRDYIPWKD